MKAQVSFGSQPQTRPPALSAQMAPAMTAKVQMGKPNTAVRCATRSRLAAAGSRDSRLPPAADPSGARASYRDRTRDRALAIPLTKKIPKPRMAVVTWIASQLERSAATREAAGVERKR